MIYPTEYVAWDLETTGLDPETSKILEIGALHVKDGEIVKQKSWFLDHGIEIPELITNITGITKAMIDADPTRPKEAIDEFLGWFEPVGWANLTHNGFKFDIPFLLEAVIRDSTFDYAEREMIKSELYTHGFDSAAMFKGRELGMKQADDEAFMFFAKRVLDTKKFGLKYNVAHCCKTLGIDTSNMTMHRALGDVFLTNQIFTKLKDL
jgi:DNA polymerase III epsilon subunit-like protein